MKFLTDEWAQAVTEKLRTDENFKNSANLSLQFIVTGGPDGDAAFYMNATGDEPVQVIGKMEEPDVTITSTYENAAKIFKGELNTQMAFMTGKIKVSGNMAKLMTQQAALGHYANAVSTLDVEY